MRDVQGIADEITRAYGVPRVRVYVWTALTPGAAAGYAYRHDWVLIRPEVFTRDGIDVVLSHELGHVTLGHQPVYLDRQGATWVQEEHERQANHRGVEILARFRGVSQAEALDRYATYLILANLYRQGRAIALPPGHRPPCEQLRDLYTSFQQTAPPCEAFTDRPKITECPYDDWMSTGCKAGQRWR